MQSTPNNSAVQSSPPNVTAVTIISLCIPGLGQFANGQVGKGLAMLALWLVLFFIWAPLILVFDCFAAWDAYSVAKTINANTEQKQQELAKIVDGQISADYLVVQIEKLNKLAKANMLTADELTDRKASVIALLETKTPASSVEDFLTSLIPLVQSEGLNSDEIAKIKAILLR